MSHTDSSKRVRPFDKEDDDDGWDDEDYRDNASFLSARSFLLFTSLLFLFFFHFPEWPEGNQTTNKRVNKETAYIDPSAL